MADEKGVWKKYDVEIIGVDIDAIHITEDRERFRKLMGEIDIPVAPGKNCTSFLEGKLCPRTWISTCNSSFIYSWRLWASFVHNKEDFEELLSKGLHFPNS